MRDTDTLEPEPLASDPRDRPFGPVAAAFLSTGIGAVVLGILTTLAEASEGIKSALEWSTSVGPLSGKTIISSGAFFIAWAALHPMLKGKPLAPRKVFIWTGMLVTIGIVLTFPIFFQLFAPAE